MPSAYALAFKGIISAEVFELRGELWLFLQDKSVAWRPALEICALDLLGCWHTPHPPLVSFLIILTFCARKECQMFFSGR